jgi:hypothetical protein
METCSIAVSRYSRTYMFIMNNDVVSPRIKNPELVTMACIARCKAEGAHATITGRVQLFGLVDRTARTMAGVDCEASTIPGPNQRDCWR